TTLFRAYSLFLKKFFTSNKSSAIIKNVPKSGVWRSLVARTAGGREVAGSNPVAPIFFLIYLIIIIISLFIFLFFEFISQNIIPQYFLFPAFYLLIFYFPRLL